MPRVIARGVPRVLAHGPVIASLSLFLYLFILTLLMLTGACHSPCVAASRATSRHSHYFAAYAAAAA